MTPASKSRRGVTALACLFAFFCGFIPAYAAAPANDEARALALLNAQSCTVLDHTNDVAQPQLVAQAVTTLTPSPSPSPGLTPSPFATPTFPPTLPGSFQVYSSPRPQSSPVTPPPIPTATPAASDQPGPVFLVRGGSTPPPILPAGQFGPSPTPEPTGVPTLPPNNVAIVADKVIGNTNQGEPGDAIGNVHIFYQEEEIVGEQAHYDGIRTVTITGHPFVYDHARNSVLLADEIVFDVIDQTAKLVNGRGTSSEGVDRGLVHYSSKDMHTDADGTAHGKKPIVTTCENPRGGYHISGKSMEVIPGDKIVIYKAILWLGAAAIFFLPKVVIPLRQVEGQRSQTQYFPNVGYDQSEGYWIKTNISYGRDQYYYGYYIVNFYTKVGLGLGYVAFYTKKNGRRSANVNYYGIHDRRSNSSNYNLLLNEQENFSQTLRGNFSFGYNSNFGPLQNIPPNTSLNGTIVHQSQRTSQNYTFNHSATGTQTSANSIAFVDQRQFNQALSEALTFNISDNLSNFAGFASSTSTAHFNSQTHFTTKGADYLLTFDKNYTQTPYGDNKEPEIQIHPYNFFPHFVVPVSAQFTAGEYNEPTTPLSTQRADLAFVLGPEIAHVFNSDLQASVNVQQYAYGTGDLKASTQQLISLTTPIGRHMVNAITYNESNFAGPSFVPFQFIDQQPTLNNKNAQDFLRLFNGDVYGLSLGFSTNFDALAQPLSYQLSSRPSPRSVLLLSGALIPGSGFPTTNLQLSTPLGYETQVQFITDIDWTMHHRLENKVIYYTKTIGECYQLQALFNQATKLVTVSINLLAFPSRAATFGVGQTGPILPTTFNF